ncbi:MAG: transglutaminase family protein [Chromatiales bacterium]|nr:transglutaminase family protein [Chromatiales bacterium]
MRYRITHLTAYHYADAVSLSYNEVRLRPLDSDAQVCRYSRVEIDPIPNERTETTDYFGNHVDRFALQTSHDQVSVKAISEVEVKAAGKMDLGMSLPWDEAVEVLAKGGLADHLLAREFVLETPMSRPMSELREYALASFPSGRPVLEAVHDLMERIHTDFTYDPGFSTIATPLSEVLEHKRGVCQDFAHLGIACVRSMGIPARYVSGYLETLPPPGKERLVGADASHAWFSVYCPNLGWQDFDPTNCIMPSERHITVARGRDYSDVAPLKGVLFGGGENKLSVSVDVAPLLEE